MTSDYTTVDNIQLFKGQHVQIVQRLSNDICLVQLVNSAENSTNSEQAIKSKQVIEVQVPIGLIKTRSKLNNNNVDGNLK